MRKPNLKFDITEQVKNLVHNNKAEHETKIIMYVMAQKGLTDNMNIKKFKRSEEDVENWSIKIHTLRYNGILIFRRFPTGFNGLQYRYEIDC